MIVLAGKGHETYQEIGTVQYPLDEREVVARWFARQEAQAPPERPGRDKMRLEKYRRM